jgi:hypothetical protein
MTELLEEVSSILSNFPNQSLQNNFDPKFFPFIHKARIILKAGTMQNHNISRVAFYNHLKRRTPKFQISEPTVFDSNCKHTVLQLLPPNIIGLSSTKEEEIEQEIIGNKFPETEQKGDSTR